jgi:hypothetical protein
MHWHSMSITSTFNEPPCPIGMYGRLYLAPKQIRDNLPAGDPRGIVERW